MRNNVIDPQDDDSELILAWVIEEVVEHLKSYATEKELAEVYTLLTSKDPVEAYDEYQKDPWI